MSTYTDPPELLDANRPSTWIRWYFSRGVLTIITIPLFLFLIYAIVVSIVGAVIQYIALLKVSWAVFGLLGRILFFIGGWIPIIIPPSLYYSILKNLPGLWIRQDASQKAKVGWTVIILFAFPLSATLLYRGIGWGIGWIADRDSCAAFTVGVTGSIPPSGCF